jgi:sn-glycerol 3-phosphate transport system permease protein
MPLLPGAAFHRQLLEALITGGGGNAPVGRCCSTLVMALGITSARSRSRCCRPSPSSISASASGMLFFWLIFLTLMLPVEVRIVPTYEVVAGLGMLNSYTGLILPLIASATATFLFRQFFMTIPDELTEAARVDGAGPMRFFFDILLPMSPHQHRGAFRHPLHLRLEPVSLAAC